MNSSFMQAIHFNKEIVVKHPQPQGDRHGVSYTDT